MENITKAAQSLVTLVGVWHPVDVPRTYTIYYNSAQFRNLKTRSRKILSDSLDIPPSVRRELQTFDSDILDVILSMYATATEGMTDEEGKAASEGKEDLTARIMADYILIAYSDHLDSLHGAASAQTCIDDIINMFPVSISTRSSTSWLH